MPGSFLASLGTASTRSKLLVAEARAVAKAEAADAVQQCADDTATQALAAQNDLETVKAADSLSTPKSGESEGALGSEASSPLLSQTELSDDVGSSSGDMRLAIRHAYTNHVIPYEHQRSN